MSRIAMLFSWVALAAAITHFALTAASDRVEIVVTYYPDNTVASISSIDTAGKRHGETRYYSDSGKLWAIVKFHRGALVTNKTYYPNGDLRSEQIEQPDFTIVEKVYPERTAKDE